MQAQDQNGTNIHVISAWQQILMFISFVLFITGLFGVGYALLASYLLPFSSNIVGIALVGLAAACIGRKSLRKMRKEMKLQ